MGCTSSARDDEALYFTAQYIVDFSLNCVVFSVAVDDDDDGGGTCNDFLHQKVEDRESEYSRVEELKKVVFVKEGMKLEEIEKWWLLVEVIDKCVREREVKYIKMGRRDRTGGSMTCYFDWGEGWCR